LRPLPIKKGGLCRPVPVLLLDIPRALTGYKLDMAVYSISTTGYELDMTGFQLDIAGYKLDIHWILTGYRGYELDI